MNLAAKSTVWLYCLSISDYLEARGGNLTYACVHYDISRLTVGQPCCRKRGTRRSGGALVAATDISPTNENLFFEEVAKMSADLKASLISQEELDRARTPRVNTHPR